MSFGAHMIVKTREQNIFARINNGYVTNDYTRKDEYPIPTQGTDKDQTLLRVLDSALQGKLVKKATREDPRQIQIPFLLLKKYELLK
jgi:hypothetical protein